MSFTGNEDHSISLTEASEMTANYRNTITGGDTIAHFFGKEYIKTILDQESCVGIRIYYALDGAGEKHLVISGVKSNEDDLYNGVLAEKALRNPPYCGLANPLNS